MSKVPQKRNLLIFCNILRKTIATAFVFYCDAKHSDTLQGSSHLCCYLLLGGCDQNWAWHFRSWNSKICCISREWIDKMSWFFYMLIHESSMLIHKFTKPNVNLIIIEWVWPKMSKTFRSYGTLKSGASRMWFD